MILRSERVDGAGWMNWFGSSGHRKPLDFKMSRICWVELRSSRIFRNFDLVKYGIARSTLDELRPLVTAVQYFAGGSERLSSGGSMRTCQGTQVDENSSAAATVRP